ncbi:ABC transporter ATP-binding protein [Halobacteriales archaeon QS_8_69_26]|nr:MAG: ABC transporter ATP-binding protein [Halobacteriales archaeon QS_8_69_26]
MTLAVEVARRFTAAGADPFEVDVDLTVREGETLVVLGPSGSGKTLLLECVAGFHDHEGRVALDGREVTGLPPEDRGFGFVFQDYALFPHVTVRENVAFGEPYHPGARDPDELLADLGVADLADRRPPTLSGGEAQRVALARSLAVDPDALLLDEPLSSLDVPTRQSLRDDLAGILAGVTALYVTHDRTTARALADRVAVMREGEVEQVGSPEAVFERPASAFVARFTGANCLRAADLPEGAVPEGADTLAIRPEHVVLTPADSPPAGDGPTVAGTTVEGRVDSVVREDAAHRVRVAVGEARVDVFADDPPAPGDTVVLGFPDDRVTALSE